MAPLGETKLMFLFVSITGEATTGAEVLPIGLESGTDDPWATFTMLLLDLLLATTRLPWKERCSILLNTGEGGDSVTVSPWDCTGKEVVVAEMFVSTGFVLATSEICKTLADCISERVCTGGVGDRTCIVCPCIDTGEALGDCDTIGGTDRINGIVACCW